MSVTIPIEKFASIQSRQQKSDIEVFLLNYAGLKLKMEKQNEQNWYFRSAAESNTRKLTEYEKKYKKMKDFFNAHSLNDLLSLKKDIEEEISKIEKSISNTQSSKFGLLLMLSQKQFELDYIDSLITMKSATEELQGIDYYITNPEKMLELFNW